MDSLRVGRSLRAVRVRMELRQADVAARARVSRALVSKLERGLMRHSDLDLIERVCVALEATLDVRLRWRGEALDRLLDQAHAVLVDRVVRELANAGWEVALEVTFNEFGDRGSIDVLGWHPDSRALLIVEVKSLIVDAQGTLVPLDRKTRLGVKIGRSRGWEARSVSRLLVVAEGSANRRRIAGLASTFDAALPLRGHAVRRWLREPEDAISGLLFLPDSPGDSARRARAGCVRVNRRKTAQKLPG